MLHFFLNINSIPYLQLKTTKPQTYTFLFQISLRETLRYYNRKPDTFHAKHWMHNWGSQLNDQPWRHTTNWYLWSWTPLCRSNNILKAVMAIWQTQQKVITAL